MYPVHNATKMVIFQVQISTTIEQVRSTNSWRESSNTQRILPVIFAGDQDLLACKISSL